MPLDCDELQLDALLFQLFALSYLLDPVLLRLLFRLTAQFQFARPRDLDRTLRFLFIYLCLINLGPVLRHVIPSGSGSGYETQGLLLDFVGRSSPPSRFHIAALDITIFLLQCTCLFIAYEAYSPSSEPDELAPELPTSPEDHDVLLESDALPKSPHENDPIIHLRPLISLRKIWNPPPSSSSPSSSTSPSSSLPLPTTTSTSTTREEREREREGEGGPFDRFIAIVERRYAERQARMDREARIPRGRGVPLTRVDGDGDGEEERERIMPGGLGGR